VNSGDALLGTASAAIRRRQKLYAGPLPKDVSGFEFETDVAPDAGGVPDKPTWSHKYKKRPGVVVEDGYAKINVKVLKIQLG
jgi:hypothetical protein